jgi:hypothetical protein
MALKIETLAHVSYERIHIPRTSYRRPSDPTDWFYPVQDIDSLENRLLIARCESDGKSATFYRSEVFGQLPDFPVLQRMIDSFIGDEPYIEEAIAIGPSDPHLEQQYNDFNLGEVVFAFSHVDLPVRQERSQDIVSPLLVDVRRCAHPIQAA